MPFPGSGARPLTKERETQLPRRPRTAPRAVAGEIESRGVSVWRGEIFRLGPRGPRGPVGRGFDVPAGVENERCRRRDSRYSLLNGLPESSREHPDRCRSNPGQDGMGDPLPPLSRTSVGPRNAAHKAARRTVFGHQPDPRLPAAAVNRHATSSAPRGGNGSPHHTRKRTSGAQPATADDPARDRVNFATAPSPWPLAAAIQSISLMAVVAVVPAPGHLDVHENPRPDALATIV
jgi:hypothetical protein